MKSDNTYRENANWSGTVSNNGLMVKILSEHIQHDITLLQLQEKYGLEIH